MSDVPKDFSDALKESGMDDFFAVCTTAPGANT